MWLNVREKEGGVGERGGGGLLLNVRELMSEGV